MMATVVVVMCGSGGDDDGDGDSEGIRGCVYILSKKNGIRKFW